ncbi:hypothetical protein SAMN04515617_1283 [Collimonas sp. OK242]|nr:hypothetical protein SAMN04515617_1283 [Collimonas sp. OK242]
MGNFYIFNRKLLGVELLIKQIFPHSSNDSQTRVVRTLALPTHDLSGDHLHSTRVTQ